MNKARFEKLCVKKITDHLSDKEQKQFENELQNKSNNQFYNQITETWNSQKQPELAIDINVQRSWDNFEKRFNIKPETKVHLSLMDVIRLHFEKRVVIGYAMAVLLIFCTSLFLWEGFVKNQTIFLTTANGQITEYTFSDNSTVVLNSASSITFKNKFSSDKRQVHLQGEALFHVTKDGRPFAVITDNAQTLVKGTTFNVWCRDNKTRVIVKEGHVQLLSDSSYAKGLDLYTDQMAQIDAKGTSSPAENIDAEYLLQWQNGVLVFEKTPVAEVVSELERRFNVNIDVDDEGLLKTTITALFKEATVEKVLQSICLATNDGYSFDKNDTQYLLRKNK